MCAGKALNSDGDCKCDGGGGLAMWMSHIVPVWPGDIAGGHKGCSLKGVTVKNSPFNNSCPTWPACPSQCPLCIYAYVYLCIHSTQKITTSGAQSLFFVVGDCTDLTLVEGR